MLILKIILAGLIFLGSNADQGWKLRKDENDIKIYTRSVEGTSFDEFKAIVTIPNTSLDAVLDILLDVENYSSLIADCADARILLRKGKYYDIHYFRIMAPWPIKDRDAIYESATTFSKDRNFAHVSMLPMGNYLKEKENLVRMYKGSGFWELEEDANKNVKFTYQFHGYPGGIIPAWLSNSVIVSNPYRTLQNLKKRVAKKTDIDLTLTF
jgi:hypothetical protein